MQQIISISIDYIVYKDIVKKKKCFTEYSFAAMDTKGRCYRFVEIVTKKNLVSNAGKQYACDKLIKIIMCYH